MLGCFLSSRAFSFLSTGFLPSQIAYNAFLKAKPGISFLRFLFQDKNWSEAENN